MTYRSLGLLLCISVATLFTGVGCAAADDADAETGGDESNFTVASGDRFIVSATSERIVFKKKVGAAPFPFDEKSLKDKAILIHPVAGKAEDGVYARAKSVRSEGDTYVVDAKPLSFLEMEAITEDDIVRIYVDGKQAPPDGQPKMVLAPAALVPLDLGAALRLSPLSGGSESDGFPFDGLGGMDSSADTPFSKINKLSPGLSFKQTVEKSKFTPNFLVDWSRAKGLEFGFRADMEWKSKAVINGTVTGEFFRSNAWESPGLWVSLPLGIVAVPVKASVRLNISCKATLVGPADVTLDVSARATVGGSFRVRPSTDKPPSEWVSEGSWPGVANGSASVDPTFNVAFRGAIACALPRIELHTKVFGVVGPVVIVMPTAIVSTEGVSAEVRVAAGLEAGIFGVGAGLEVPVYTLKL